LKRLTSGGALAFLVAAGVAVVAPTGADAAPNRPGPSAHTLASSAAASYVAARPAKLKVGAHDSFQQLTVLSVPEGLQYVSYGRGYKGLPVVGGDFVVITDANGTVKDSSVAQTGVIGEIATSARLSAARAQQLSRKELSSVTSVGAARLVIYTVDSAPTLAWSTRVNGTDAGEPSSQDVYVNAATGKILGTTEHVLAGDGTAAYSGPNPLHLDTTLSGSTYSMKDPNTTNLSCQDSANNTTFSGPDDLWGNGNATNRETGCVDALFAAQTEKKMLSAWPGRNGMDGSGGAWPIRVGLNDVNAYYDGTQVQIGHNNAGQWISSVDVVAHEMGHGIDDHTPGGISRSGTQEFVADVFGATTEWYANEPSAYDPPDFLVGEEINLVGQGPIRNMYNPSALGDPNCYSSSIPITEVHAAAGPGNHWFYLLAEGSNPTDGQPTSPTCNGTTVTGVGIQKAIKIMYNAMLMKTTSSSYLKYRTWTLTAAKNLYPGSCTEFNAVRAAWNAVSVPAQAGDPTCTVSGAVTVTNPGSRTGTVGSATSLQLSATGGTGSYTWTATGLPAGLSISSGGLISGTPTTAATYSVTATATDSASASGSATFTWTINPSGGGGCSGQKLGNPGFETGTATPWSASAGVIDNSASQPAHSGSWKAWLDGYGSSHTDTLTQSVSIPSGCAATLSFWLHIDSAETTTSVAYDKLTVKIGSTTLATYSNLNKASGYSQKSFNVSSFAGQTVTVSFSGVEDFSLQTSFVVDDTALTLS